MILKESKGGFNSYIQLQKSSRGSKSESRFAFLIELRGSGFGQSRDVHSQADVLS